MKPEDLLLGRAILDETIAGMSFYRCICGNEQPCVLGKPRPDCESCGRVAPDASPPWPRDPNCPRPGPTALGLAAPPDREWCRFHNRWETAQEARACDQWLYENGYRNIAGAIVQLTPEQIEEIDGP